MSFQRHFVVLMLLPGCALASSTHCAVIPFPPASANYAFRPPAGSSLTLMSNYSTYEPSTPVRIAVHPDFSAGGRYLLLTGVLPSSSSKFTATLETTDAHSRQALIAIVTASTDPKRGSVLAMSIITSYAPAQHAAPVPVGQLFSFEISYDASVPSFGFKVDDTALPNFVLPANTGPIPFSELHVVGAVDIQFMGAPLTGDRPEVPVGGVVTFECASGRRFASDWDTTPATVSITCMSDGNFSAPDEWEECSSRPDQAKIPAGEEPKYMSCDAVAYVANPPTTNSSALDKLCKDACLEMKCCSANGNETEYRCFAKPHEINPIKTLNRDVSALPCQCFRSEVKRLPGLFCGPNKIACRIRNANDSYWVDGENTHYAPMSNTNLKP